MRTWGEGASLFLKKKIENSIFSNLFKLSQRYDTRLRTALVMFFDTLNVVITASLFFEKTKKNKENLLLKPGGGSPHILPHPPQKKS